MIHASISIRVKGQIYKYVRDVTTDTAGVGGQHYAYRGNARRKINFADVHINERDSGLKPKVSYEFRVAVNGGALTTYSINFSDTGRPISFWDVINRANGVSNDFKVIYDDTNRSQEGIYFVSNVTAAGSAINVVEGVANDLFTNLKGFVSIGDEIPSDNFFDQNNAAGQILHDLGTLTTQLSEANIDDVPMLLFPESGGDTEMLIRESHEIKDHLVVNHVIRKSIDGFNIIEINKNVREGHVG